MRASMLGGCESEALSTGLRYPPLVGSAVPVEGCCSGVCDGAGSPGLLWGAARCLGLNTVLCGCGLSLCVVVPHRCGI